MQNIIFQYDIKMKHDCSRLQSPDAKSILINIIRIFNGLIRSLINKDIISKCDMEKFSNSLLIKYFSIISEFIVGFAKVNLGKDIRIFLDIESSIYLNGNDYMENIEVPVLKIEISSIRDNQIDGYIFEFRFSPYNIGCSSDYYKAYGIYNNEKHNTIYYKYKTNISDLNNIRSILCHFIENYIENENKIKDSVIKSIVNNDPYTFRIKGYPVITHSIFKKMHYLNIKDIIRD